MGKTNRPTKQNLLNNLLLEQISYYKKTDRFNYLNRIKPTQRLNLQIEQNCLTLINLTEQN